MLQLSYNASNFQALKANNSQRVGNQSDYKLSKTRMNDSSFVRGFLKTPDLLQALLEKVTNNKLLRLGHSELVAKRTEPIGKLGPREAESLEGMISAIKENGVEPEMLEHFVTRNIQREEVFRALTRFIPTGLAAAALSLCLNVNPAISSHILYALGVIAQSSRSSEIRAGLDLLKRNAFR
jgi:hypothetical protein